MFADGYGVGEVKILKLAYSYWLRARGLSIFNERSVRWRVIPHLWFPFAAVRHGFVVDSSQVVSILVS